MITVHQTLYTLASFLSIALYTKFILSFYFSYCIKNTYIGCFSHGKGVLSLKLSLIWLPGITRATMTRFSEDLTSEFTEVKFTGF